MTNSDNNLSLLEDNTSLIEAYLCSYLAYTPAYTAKDFVTSLTDDFLQETCPEAIDLPAALIVQEEIESLLISIHLRQDIYDTLNSISIDQSTLATDRGLSAFLILIEEISHFHYYARHAETKTPLSRLEMEIQAELEKIIVASLMFQKTFGRSHVKFLTQKIFDQSIITGSLTDYNTASKIAEKFWKQNLIVFGEDLIFTSKFRRSIQEISRRTGQQKQWLLQDNFNQLAA